PSGTDISQRREDAASYRGESRQSSQTESRTSSRDRPRGGSCHCYHPRVHRAAPSRIVTGVFGALAGDGTSGVRRAVAATAVAVLVLVSIPLLLIAFLAPLLLFGHVVGPMLPVSGAHPAVSWVAVWIVVAAFLAVSTGAVLLSRRRTRVSQEELDGASDPPAGAVAERVTRNETPQ